MKPDVDAAMTLSCNEYALRFWVWLGEQAIVRVVRLGWLH